MNDTALDFALDFDSWYRNEYPRVCSLRTFKDENHAQFVANEGFELSYERLEGFSSMPCKLTR